MSILIVEDNPVSAKVLEVNLRNEGYKTLCAANGKEALEVLEAHPEVQLILSDVMMPEMDGMELLRAVRGRPEWRDTPVILCTALADAESVKKAVRWGCRHYLVKPIKRAQLIRKVKEALEGQKPVLKDKSHILTTLSLDEEDYDKIASAFLELVNRALSSLEGPHDPDDTLGLPPGMDVQLMEAAETLGAERLQHLLESIDRKTPKEARPLLHRELTLLKNALQKSVSPPQEEVPGPESPQQPPQKEKAKAQTAA
jgi:CheY-like chemotaxis protein